MNDKSESHLMRVKKRAWDLIDKKYREGNAEHDDEGDLLDHPALLDESISEAVDLVVYLLTLKEQVEKDVPQPISDEFINNFLDGLPNAWCDDCEHPVCVAAKASAKDTIKELIIVKGRII